MEKKFFSKVMLSAVVATSLISAEIQLESRSNHNIYLSTDGTVWTWGNNALGELGNGDKGTPVYIPTKVASLSNIKSIAAGIYSSFAVDNSGNLYAWGYEQNGNFGNENGQLADEFLTPTDTGIDNVQKVASSYYTTVILKEDGSVYHVGYTAGATVTKVMIDENTPLLGVVEIAAGDYHGLAVTQNGDLYAWGLNDVGQLGDDTTTSSTYAKKVSTISNVKEIGAGWKHSVALTMDGKVYAWGSDDNYANGKTADTHVPTLIINGDVEHISVSNRSTIAIKTDGTITGFGANTDGMMGSNTTTNNQVGVTIPLDATVKFKDALAFAAGGLHSLVIDANGSLYASGSNLFGQHGDGTTINSTVFDTNSSLFFATLTNTTITKPCDYNATLAEGKAYVVEHPSEFGLFTTTQITTQLNDLNTTLTTQYETQLNELNTTLTTQYATQLNEMNTTAYANGIAYVLSHLTEHNLTTKALFDTAVADGASALSTCNAEKLTEYNSGYDIGFVAGENNVTNTPSAYGLVASSSCSTSTLTEDDLYAEFIKGKNEVIENPSLYGLVASSDIINATGNSVNIKKGWALYGFDRAIDVLSKFSEEYRITSIWGFDTASGKWKAFSPDSYYKVLIADAGLEELSQLNKNEGFWINSKTDFTFTMEDEDNNVTEVTHNGITYGFITSSVTGKVWLDKNLGATQACTAIDDTLCYGDLYQWGRSADGHQLRTSSASATLESAIVSTSEYFTTSENDWTTVDTNGSLRGAAWSATDGSSICPKGFRVPIIEEIVAEVGETPTAETIYDVFGIPTAGGRSGYDGAVVSGITRLWSTTESNGIGIGADATGAGSVDTYTKSSGASVRCIKD